MLFCNRHCLNVTERPIIAFKYNRIDGCCCAANIRIFGNRVTDQCVGTGPHTKCICKKNWSFKRSQFLDLQQTGALAKAIDNIACSKYLATIRVPIMRNDSSYTRIDVTVA